ncbi:hypothetical protein [Streptomyces sp. NPDC020747]|uniref:hypothetical protein n=1 Tax=Streptomyces sp. NPDC020747 TaxID=3365086 RepID=UPI0037B4A5FF
MATEETSAAGAAGTQRLLKYWAFGAGAAKIQAGTPGAFRRCQAELGRYIQGRQLDGFCARVIHEVTGEWPGQHRDGKDDD